ncbi:MAG: type II toxin-antitoxin system PemK/MazF family toxin [Armatimonadetes bacterium]|nr:type II toxin-antitoxin system PemK/MazF family toxin [Armatimonadota bacterium]
MRRGEIWWANMAAPMGRRPVVLVTRDGAYRARSSVTVALITRTVRNIPVEVPVGSESGLKYFGAVNADELSTIPKSLLGPHIGALPDDKMEAVDRALHFALGLKD